jgi:predicted glycoside hydrolase/deacetylase ChbG (UPF0249 family)
VRRLIINADDLGLTEGVNRAILEAAQHGVVTSATLMANGVALQDAVRQLNSLSAEGRLSIGCHLCLVDGSPLSPPKDVFSLLESTGEFRRTIGKFGLAARRGHISADEIEREATAQFRALQSLGVQLSHFDAHKHSHMFPEVLAPALRAAVNCGIRRVRNPFESARPFPFSLLAHHPRLLKRYLQVKVLGTMRSKWRKLVQRYGLNCPDGSLGVIATGDLDETILRAIFEHMPQGTWELVCHPGYNDSGLGQIRTRLRESREQEQRLLTSEKTRTLLDGLGIELISYNEL